MADSPSGVSAAAASPEPARRQPLPFLNPVELRSFAGLFVMSLFVLEFLFFLVWLAGIAMRFCGKALVGGDPQAYFAAVPVFTIGVAVLLLCVRGLIDLIGFFHQCVRDPSCFEAGTPPPLWDRLVALALLFLAALPHGALVLSSIQWARKPSAGVLESAVAVVFSAVSLAALPAWLFWALPERLGWRPFDRRLGTILEKGLWVFVAVGLGVAVALLSDSF